MTQPTLGQMLQAQFGGRIDCKWGNPREKNVRADLIGIKAKPSDEQIDQILVNYFESYEFIRVGTRSPPVFEDKNHKNRRASCYTYHRALEKLIVSAREF